LISFSICSTGQVR